MYNLKNKNNKMVSIKHFYVERKHGGTYTILIRIEFMKSENYSSPYIYRGNYKFPL